MSCTLQRTSSRSAADHQTELNSLLKVLLPTHPDLEFTIHQRNSFGHFGGIGAVLRTART